MKYRPDIDGLRAIAILLVVCYHARISCPGGFIGVDVFFVISGYLISGLTARELQEGSFSLPRFFFRRLRRLAPALLATMSVTWLVGWVVLIPDDFERLGLALLAQASCVSNVYFWQSIEKGYFAGGQEVYPSLHTWSLSVEEQYYLGFAACASVVAKYWSTLQRKMLAVGLTLFFLFAVSLLLCIMVTTGDPTASFYLIPFRIWEFLVGTAAYWVGNPGGREHRVWAEVTSLSGLALIVVPAFVYSDATLFPGAAAAAPVLGTALVIWSGDSRKNVLKELLILPPIVWIGRLSYSWYLWHWPVLSFVFLLRGTRSGFVGSSLLLCFSFCLAMLSYRYIEVPIRQGRLWAGSSRLGFYCAGWTMLVVVVSSWTYCNNGLPGRLPADLQRQLTDTRPVPDRLKLNSGPTDVEQGKVIWLGRREAPIDYMIWGDSHARALLPVFDRCSKRLGLSGVGVVYAASPPLMGGAWKRVSDFSLGPDDQQRWSLACLDLVRRKRIRNVFLAARWTYYGEDVYEGLIQTVKELGKTKARVWIVRDVPFPGDEVRRRIAFRLRFGLDTDGLGISPEDYRRRTDLTDRAAAALAGEVEVFSTDAPFLGPNNRFRLSGPEGFYFLDGDHLSIQGAYLLSPSLTSLLQTLR